MYTLILNITAKNNDIDDKQFHSLLAPSIAHLDSLKGAFEPKRQNMVRFFPPGAQSEWW